MNEGLRYFAGEAGRSRCIEVFCAVSDTKDQKHTAYEHLGLGGKVSIISAYVGTVHLHCPGLGCWQTRLFLGDGLRPPHGH